MAPCLLLSSHLFLSFLDGAWTREMAPSFGGAKQPGWLEEGKVAQAGLWEKGGGECAVGFSDFRG